MTQERKGSAWLFGVAGLAMAFTSFSGAAMAQTGDAAAQEETQTAEEVVVLGRISYRNRVEGAPPVLDYGIDYFQRFEPLTVGDALKRVPSVAFLSDVLESDGVRLRGLDPAYTQILINGEQVPGSGSSSGAFGNGADGSFFVDRIPAELIERVEVVRSASANRSGDAVAGAINIVLRDSYSLDGGFIRAGVLHWANDKRFGETLGGVWGGEALGGRLLVGANMQDRHNPKDKFSQRFDEPGGTLDNTEVQTDVRDGTDYSANFSYEVDAFGGELKLDGFYVHTDRYQDEDSIEYLSGVATSANVITLNSNDVDITQDSYSLNGRYAFDMAGGETRVKLGYAHFEADEPEFETEVEYRRDAVAFPEADRITHDLVAREVTDDEIKAKLEHEREVGFGALEFGVHYEQKERDIFAGEGRFRTNIANNTQLAVAYIPSFPGYVAPTIEANPGGDNTIERTRLDPYVMVSGSAGALTWEAGVRYETTNVEIEDRTTGDTIENDYGIVLPSAHIKWSLTPDDRLHFSAARTVRNPSFDFLSPALLEAELGDNDFFGNPELEPETALGFDVGYERRLGLSGVAGINFFYRDITDLLEVYNTLEEGSEGDGTFVYTARNTGDGQVYGVEFDLSAPLTIIGMENTGVFLNYSWLDSKIDDEFGERTFNSQAESVFNVGFIQDIPSWAASFGLTYRDQGDAYSRVVGEEVLTSYGADLEFFVEKRLGERFTVRLTGSNLLDESKDETFDKFTTIEDQVDRSYDEYELETESAGPVYQLIGRYAF